MKNILVLLACLMVAIFAVACSPAKEPINPLQEDNALQVEQENEPEQQEPELLPAFEGKIAILTQTDSNLAYSTYPLISKYGSKKVITEAWPIHHWIDVDLVEAMFTKLENDTDIKAIIANPLVWTGNPFFEKLRETREDIFVIYCDPWYDSYESWGAIAETADLVLKLDELGMGQAMIQEAQKLGAKTFVHYSIPRHMVQPLYSERRDLIKEECEELGIKFVDAAAIDANEVGIAVAQQFILDDVPKMVEKHGKDTAFFATYCSIQTPLITSVADTSAINPQPCHPFHLHGELVPLDYHLDYWLGQKIGGDYWWNDLDKWWVNDTYSLIDEYNDFLIDYRRTTLAEKDLLGRFSNWPVDYEFMFTYIAAEYAIKWINGEVPKESVDVDVLKQMMEDYAGVEVYLTPFVDDGTYDLENSSEPTGETYNNFLLMRMDYITY